MQLRRHPPPRSSQPAAYEIKVEGVVNAYWSEWFNGLTLKLESEPAPVTTLTGVVPDQAALRGILNKLWDLNVTLISVTPISVAPETEVRHDR